MSARTASEVRRDIATAVGVDSPEEVRPPSRNAEFDWDHFDSDDYFNHNYRTLRDDDREIIGIVRDFFASADIRHNSRGLDVGSGTNLYPAFSMLPFCAAVDLCEYSTPNVEWLTREVGGFGGNWDEFWKVYSERGQWAGIADPRPELARKATVTKANVFRLPPRHWDLGTMFFVACSLSTVMAEFRAAIDCFAGALKPDAPFAAAFMAKSTGYRVGHLWFPAVAVDAAEVERSLDPVAYDVDVREISMGAPLREGYGIKGEADEPPVGMIVATGRARNQSDGMVVGAS